MSNFFFGLYVFSMFAKGFLRLIPPPERFWLLKSGPGEKGRTQAWGELLCPVLPAEPWPLWLGKTPASLRALFLLIRMISAGRLKLGE